MPSGYLHVYLYTAQKEGLLIGLVSFSTHKPINKKTSCRKLNCNVAKSRCLWLFTNTLRLVKIKVPYLNKPYKSSQPSGYMIHPSPHATWPARPQSERGRCRCVLDQRNHHRSNKCDRCHPSWTWDFRRHGGRLDGRHGGVFLNKPISRAIKCGVTNRGECGNKSGTLLAVSSSFLEFFELPTLTEGLQNTRPQDLTKTYENWVQWSRNSSENERPKGKFSKTFGTWNLIAVHYIHKCLSIKLHDEPNLYLENAWNSPFPSI